MGKSKRNQDYAEDMDFSQSSDMEVETLSDTTSDDLKAVVKELSADVKAVTKYNETLGLAIDGIGRFLLNEDGSTRDFTNKELMDETAKKVDAGLKQMNANAQNIHNRIEQFPTHMEHSLAPSSILVMDDFNSNMRFQRLMFIIAVVVIALFAGYTAFRYYDVAKRSEEMSQWYEENREAIVFGRYLRMHENGLWKRWHDAIKSDPGLDAEMYDYFKMKEWEDNKK